MRSRFVTLFLLMVVLFIISARNWDGQRSGMYRTVMSVLDPSDSATEAPKGPPRRCEAEALIPFDLASTTNATVSTLAKPLAALLMCLPLAHEGRDEGSALLEALPVRFSVFAMLKRGSHFPLGTFFDHVIAPFGPESAFADEHVIVDVTLRRNISAAPSACAMLCVEMPQCCDFTMVFLASDAMRCILTKRPPDGKCLTPAAINASLTPLRKRKEADNVFFDVAPLTVIEHDSLPDALHGLVATVPRGALSDVHRQCVVQSQRRPCFFDPQPFQCSGEPHSSSANDAAIPTLSCKQSNFPEEATAPPTNETTVSMSPARYTAFGKGGADQLFSTFFTTDLAVMTAGTPVLMTVIAPPGSDSTDDTSMAPHCASLCAALRTCVVFFMPSPSSCEFFERFPQLHRGAARRAFVILTPFLSQVWAPSSDDTPSLRIKTIFEAQIASFCGSFGTPWWPTLFRARDANVFHDGKTLLGLPPSHAGFRRDPVPFVPFWKSVARHQGLWGVVSAVLEGLRQTQPWCEQQVSRRFATLELRQSSLAATKGPLDEGSSSDTGDTGDAYSGVEKAAKRPKLPSRGTPQQRKARLRHPAIECQRWCDSIRSSGEECVGFRVLDPTTTLNAEGAPTPGHPNCEIQVAGEPQQNGPGCHFLVNDPGQLHAGDGTGSTRCLTNAELRTFMEVVDNVVYEDRSPRHELPARDVNECIKWCLSYHACLGAVFNDAAQKCILANTPPFDVKAASGHFVLRFARSRRPDGQESVNPQGQVVPRIVYGVLAGGDYLHQRILPQLQTFLRDEEAVVVCESENAVSQLKAAYKNESQIRGTPRVMPVFEPFPSGTENGHTGLRGAWKPSRVLAAMLRAKPGADWYIMIDDDTFMMRHNVLWLMSHMDAPARRRIPYFGGKYISYHESGVPYISGSSGTYYNRAAAEMFAKSAVPDICVHAEAQYSYGDVRMGECAALLGMAPTDGPPCWRGEHLPEILRREFDCAVVYGMHHYKQPATFFETDKFVRELDRWQNEKGITAFRVLPEKSEEPVATQAAKPFIDEPLTFQITRLRYREMYGDRGLPIRDL